MSQLASTLESYLKEFWQQEGLSCRITTTASVYIRICPSFLVRLKLLFCWRRASLQTPLFSCTILDSIAKIPAGSCREWKQGTLELLAGNASFLPCAEGEKVAWDLYSRAWCFSKVTVKLELWACFQAELNEIKFGRISRNAFVLNFESPSNR